MPNTGMIVFAVLATGTIVVGGGVAVYYIAKNNKPNTIIVNTPLPPPQPRMDTVLLVDDPFRSYPNYRDHRHNWAPPPPFHPRGGGRGGRGGRGGFHP